MHSLQSNAYGLLLLLGLTSICIGCADGTKSGSSQTDSVAPSILIQPAYRSIPMGLTATFAVSASGSNLKYQWSKNGSAIQGAIGATYTTPALEFSDTGSSYVVTVSNALGTVSSNTAGLTVTARAPAAGDLRFQQVDAASTLNGYTIAPSAYGSAIFAPPPGGGVASLDFNPASGSALFLGNNCCSWPFTAFSLPTGMTGLATGYTPGRLEDFASVLAQPGILAGAGALNGPNTVITSLSFAADPTADTFAISYIQSSQSSGFDVAQHTVDPEDFQAAATQEGVHSRVITAASYNGNQIIYLSYGWTKDLTTTYESKVVLTTLNAAIAAATSLAQQGYIITASGSELRADGTGILLVGTRVMGDTLPRPFLIGSNLSGSVSPDEVFDDGYAVVAVVTELAENSLVTQDYIGER